MHAVALASSALTVGADGGQCADAGPFPCLGAACPSPTADCDFLSRVCLFDASEPLLELRRPIQQGGGSGSSAAGSGSSAAGGSSSYAGTDLIIGDLCPESCGLCDERCERRAPSTPLAPPVPPSDLSAAERAAWLAAGREKPNDHRCIVDHWVDAVRHQHRADQHQALRAERAERSERAERAAGAAASSNGAEMPLTRRTIAQALVRVLGDETLHLAGCGSTRLICHPGRPRLQSWVLAPARGQPLQSCPEGGGELDLRGAALAVAAPLSADLARAEIEIAISAAEHAEAALRRSTLARARRALRQEGVAALLGALQGKGLQGGDLVSELRAQLLRDVDAKGKLRRVNIIASEQRDHVLLEPDDGNVARALTALGVRIDVEEQGNGHGHGQHTQRRGPLAHIVPDGATITELGAIIVYGGASEQRLHTDVEMHYGSAGMTTAFVVLQDTPAERGALRVARASHTTSCRGDMEAFFEGVECDGTPNGTPNGNPNGTPNGDPNGDTNGGAANASSVGLPIAMPAGSVLLMDSRALHGGGAHTMHRHHPHSDAAALPASNGVAHHTEPPGHGGDRRYAGARVVFYFSYASARTASAPYLPIGSTYALRGEMWGRMAVPLRPMGMAHHPMHTPTAYASSRASLPVPGDITSAISGATSATSGATSAISGASSARAEGVPEVNRRSGEGLGPGPADAATYQIPPEATDQWSARRAGAANIADNPWSIVDLVTVRLEMCLQDGKL